MRRLWLLFNVRPGEETRASLMLAHAFFMGVSTVFFETAASALFLAHFHAVRLPFVYISAAIVSAVTGLAYSSLRRRVAFWNLMSGTLLFLFASVLAGRLGLALSSAGVVVFGIFVWYRLISILTDLEYWAVATHLYDLRQSKRLFGFIGSGEVIARIVSSYSVAILVRRIGAANLILVSASGLAACLALLVCIRHSSDEDAKNTPSEAPDRFRVLRPASLLRNRYVTLIFAVSMAGILGKHFVDFAFLQQMQVRYRDVNHLAAFFGVFSGTTQLLNLLIRVLFSGRLLNRYGIRVGLVTLPTVHAVCTLLIIVGAAVTGNAPLVFWLVIVNQGIYKTLKHPIENPSVKVLYQPLRSDTRLAVQIANEMIVNPVGIGVAGCIMLLFTTVLPYDAVRFALLMLGTFLVWLVAAQAVYRRYGEALREALRTRAVDHATFSLAELTAVSLIRSRLESSYPGDVIYALSLLEKLGTSPLDSEVVARIDHPSPDVRRFALGVVERLKIASGREAARQRLDDEKEDPSVRAEALHALCAIDPELASIDRYLDHSVSQLRRTALLHLLRHDASDESIVTNHLLPLVRSGEPAARSLAAEIIGESDRADLYPLLVELSSDPDHDVRRFAIGAAGKTRKDEAYPMIVSRLSDPVVCDAAASALVSAGVRALPALDTALSSLGERSTLIRVARVCGRIGGDSAISILESRIDFPDGEVRSQILASLAHCEYRPPETDHAAVRRQIRAEVAEATSHIAALLDLSAEEQLSLLRSSIVHDIEQARDRALLLLSYLYEPRTIARARIHLMSKVQEKRAYALELIDLTLSDELKQFVVPLLEEIPDTERLRRLSHFFPQRRLNVRDRLRTFLTDASESPWTVACALKSAGDLRLHELEPNVENLIGDRHHPIVREAAAATLNMFRDIDARRPSMFSTIERVLILKTVGMFSNTSEEALSEIALAMEQVDVAPGEAILRKGDVGDSLYVIATGRVRVHDGGVTIAELGDRDIFGELALLDPEPRSASVTAQEACVLLRLDRDELFELLPDHIEIVKGIFHVLCSNLRSVTTSVTAQASPRSQSER